MLERLRTFAIVTLIALTFWLFAEAESLGQFSGLTTVQFIAGPGEERLIRPAEGFGGSVTIDVTGSKAALARAGSVLGAGLKLEPGMPGVPTNNGRHTIDLLRALQSYTPLSGTGAQIVSVRPQLVDVTVTELITPDVPIDPMLNGIEVVGAVRVTPEAVPLRLPKASWELNREVLRIPARLSESQRRALPPSGTVRQTVRIELPESIAALPGVSLGVSDVMLEFTVRARTDALPLSSIPVQVVVPPVEAGKWTIDIAKSDRFLQGEVSGPKDQIERLRSGADGVVALVSLSSDDLVSGLTTKAVSFFVLRNGAVTPLGDLTVATNTQSVALTITRPKADPTPLDAPGDQP